MISKPTYSINSISTSKIILTVGIKGKSVNQVRNCNLKFIVAYMSLNPMVNQKDSLNNTSPLFISQRDDEANFASQKHHVKQRSRSRKKWFG